MGEAWAGRMVSPEGIDYGKARPKAEAVWLSSSGRANSSGTGLAKRAVARSVVGSPRSRPMN